MVFKWRLKAWVFGLAVLVAFVRDGVMNPGEALGCMEWALLFWLGWKMLKAQHWQPTEEPSAIPSTQPIRVISRTGPAWEQDAPYPEAFDGEDDL